MTIRYKCAECGARLTIKDRLAGTPGKCPGCGTKFMVPGLDKHDDEPVSSAARVPAAATHEDPTDVLFEDIEEETVPPSAPVPTAALFDDFDSQTDDPDFLARGSRQRQTDVGSGSASGNAADLLARSAEDKRAKAGRTNLDERPGVDYLGFVRQIVTEAVLPLIGIGFFAWILYTLSTDAMGTDLEVPPLTQVQGTVTLDGKPLSNAGVTFTPLDFKIDHASSSGTTDANGRYELFYQSGDKGAVRGRHRIKIKLQDGTGFIPRKYNVHSALQETVGEKPHLIDFALTY